MIGTLNNSQIHEILRQQLFGRLGCFDGDSIYVVPVSFVFDGKFIYVHSREGRKIELLRKNANVSFQVDVIDNNRFGVLHVSQSISRSSENIRPPVVVEKKKRAVYFKISINEASGRFERPI